MDSSWKSIIRYTITALCSWPCEEFNSFVKGIKSGHDSGVEAHANISFEELAASGRNKFLNQVADKEYNKVDPRQAQIMAFVTQVNQLKEAQIKTALSIYSSGTGKCPRNGNFEKTPGLDRTLVPGTTI